MSAPSSRKRPPSESSEGPSIKRASVDKHLGRYWAVVKRKDETVLNTVAFASRERAMGHMAQQRDSGDPPGARWHLCSCAVHASFSGASEPAAAVHAPTRGCLFFDLSDKGVWQPTDFPDKEPTRAGLLLCADNLGSVHEGLLMRAHQKFCREQKPHTDYRACLLASGYAFIMEPVTVYSDPLPPPPAPSSADIAVSSLLSLRHAQ